MKNQEIAKILYEIADLLEIEGVEFKPRAYRRAAQNIESLSVDIEELYKKEQLDKIPGVGKSIAEKIKSLRNGAEECTRLWWIKPMMEFALSRMVL